MNIFYQDIGNKTYSSSMVGMKGFLGQLIHVRDVIPNLYYFHV